MIYERVPQCLCERILFFFKPPRLVAADKIMPQLSPIINIGADSSVEINDCNLSVLGAPIYIVSHGMPGVCAVTSDWFETMYRPHE